MKTIAICISEVLKLMVIMLFIGLVSATLTGLLGAADNELSNLFDSPQRGAKTKAFTNQ